MINDDDTFACIRCGKSVYHSVTSCPHCGLDFLPGGFGEDDELPEVTASPASARRFGPMVTTIGSGMIGLFVAGVCSLAFIHLAFPSLPCLPLIVAGCCGAFASGYCSRAMSGALPGRLGIAYGLLNTLPPALMALSGRLTLPYTLCIVILCAVICTFAALAGGKVYLTLFHRANAQPETATSDDDLYLDLLQRLGFDQSRVKRLLELERQNDPLRSRREVLRRALQRVERDNR